jgi:MFS family permease
VLTLAVGLLALGLVKAPDWGWADGRTIEALAAAATGLAAFWRRCRSHPSPVIDPSLLRVRSYALTNAAALLFSASFAGMLLGAVLFLTGVWHDSILTVGSSIAPGPLTAAALAPPAGRLAHRLGQRNLAVAGMTLFGLGCAWWLWRVTATPDYAAAFLPGIVIAGAGVGLTLPSLAGAAAASLPPARFATGSAVFTTARQVGFVLGVAILVAVLGAGGKGNPVGSFERGWLFMVIAATLGAVAALGIGAVQQTPAAPRTVAVMLDGGRS